MYLQNDNQNTIIASHARADSLIFGSCNQTTSCKVRSSPRQSDHRHPSQTEHPIFPQTRLYDSSEPDDLTVGRHPGEDRLCARHGCAANVRAASINCLERSKPGRHPIATSPHSTFLVPIRYLPDKHLEARPHLFPAASDALGYQPTGIRWSTRLVGGGRGCGSQARMCWPIGKPSSISVTLREPPSSHLPCTTIDVGRAARHSDHRRRKVPAPRETFKI